MADEKKNQELSEEELQQAAGGKRMARSGDLNPGGTVVPNAGGGSNDDGNDGGPTIGDVTPLDDPAFQ